MKRRGRPRKAWDELCLADDWQPPDCSLGKGPVGALDTPRLPPWVNAVDREVLHHYLGHTSNTLGDRVWEDKVPILALRSPAVLHLLLALSAFHLARLRPHRRPGFQERAEHHLAVGLHQAIPLASEANGASCDALFICSVLLCFICLAKEPAPGHLLLVADGGGMSWWYLVRGVRVVTKTMGLDAIFSGVLGPRVINNPPSTHPMKQRKGQMVPWEQSLAAVSDLIAMTTGSERDIYMGAMTALSTCFMNIYGFTEDPKDDEVSDEPLVLEWMDSLEEAFVNCIKDGHAVALIILAHYAILLKKLQFLWYMDRWAERVLCGIIATLDPQYRDWLYWPQEEITRLECRRLSIGALARLGLQNSQPQEGHANEAREPYIDD